MLLNRFKLFIFSVLVILNTYSPAKAELNNLRPMAVFGEDNRREIFETSSKWQEIGKSIAGKVTLERIKNQGSHCELSGAPLKERECAGNKFSEQITVPNCTGFLVKQNILVTAAHCMKVEEDCSAANWVFGYALSNAGTQKADYTKINSNDVYKCKRVITIRYKNFGNIDYAIIELDRPVADRKPLQLGFDLELKPGQSVVNIGHSNGLPLKFKDSATIIGLTLDNQAIDTNLDMFTGDSGSPVFDESTGLVIGITSHGHSDHYHDPIKMCRTVKVCLPGDDCYLSTASRISNLKDEAVFK